MGRAGTASATLEMHYAIDGDYQSDSKDLCYECAEKVAKYITTQLYSHGEEQ